MHWSHLILLTSLIGFASLNQAAVLSKSTSSQSSFQSASSSHKSSKSHSFQRQIGEVAGAGFSLLNLQKIEAKTGNTERLIFSIGDREGQPIMGAPGYFNVQNQDTRITLDFAQMPHTKIDEKTIRQILKGSKLIRKAQLIQDPLDQTLTLVLDLSNPVNMKTLQVKGQKQTARVVLDIIKR